MKRDKVYLAGPSVSAAGCQNLFQTHRETFGSVKGRGMVGILLKSAALFCVIFPFHSKDLMFYGALLLRIVNTGKAEGTLGR